MFTLLVNYHIPKAPAIQNISSKFGNQTKNSFYIMAKLKKPILLKVKKANILSFIVSKSGLTEKLRLQTSIFVSDSESYRS